MSSTHFDQLEAQKCKLKPKKRKKAAPVFLCPMRPLCELNTPLGSLKVHVGVDFQGQIRLRANAVCKKRVLPCPVDNGPIVCG